MNTTALRFTCVVALLVTSLAAAQVRVVNMVPNNRSGETNQDAEPTITVDPLDANRMVGSAFTWDNLTQSPMVTATAPVYVSTDRGNTWTLAFIVPSKLGNAFPTGDINVAFGGTLSGAPAHTTSWFFAGTLSAATSGYPVAVLRAQDPYSSTVMTTLDTRSGNVDQPHLTARSAPAGQVRLYVGFNNGYSCIVANGRTSTVDVSQDATVASPTFALDVIEARDTHCQDGFAQVPTAHPDGTVYAAFIHDWSSSPRMVVVRDDNWGSGASAFQALTDPSDGKAGRFIAPAMTLPSGTMGQQRLGASNVSIAVDPNDSDRVYVAWGSSGGSSGTETIHVRRSVNRGVDWSNTDLLTVTNAMNPQVAITSVGTVGVLYQQVVSSRWETHLVRTTDADGTTFDTPGIVLANQSATTPVSTIASSVYVGDYASLVTAGRNFIGMFSTSNYPDRANFPLGISYQREVDWTKHKLYTDASHTTEVSPSIDPFFFEAPWSICRAIPGICNICRTHPNLCFPIYDPWWKLKCPQCLVQILLDPGDLRVRVVLYDERGHAIGTFRRLAEPVVVKGIKYTMEFRTKVREGATYVARAEVARTTAWSGDFNPAHLTRIVSR